jgi:glycosyltransferase involved in cell wall biosynthesis
LPIPRLTSNFYKQIKEYKLDLVHIHSPFGVGKMGIKYAKEHNIPVIGTMHSQFKQDLKRYIKSDLIVNYLIHQIIKTFNKCNECFAVNSEVARMFYEDYGYKEMPKVLNNATDLMPIKDIKESNKLINKKYNIKASDKVFLFVGRINKLKNILFIVDALKIVKNNNIKFKMLFAGEGQDENELKERIHLNKLDNDVILCGKIIDRKLISSLYARADLFLFPSLYDASSLVQIEAASQKTPTVFIENSVTSTTVTNKVNGFTTKYNVKDYANKIIEVLKDKKLYEEVSNNAYKDLYKNWDNLVKEVYEIYTSLIEKW